METFPALLALCAGNFDVFFDLCLNKRSSKHSRPRWFETPSHPLWCHCNVPISWVFQRNILLTSYKVVACLFCVRLWCFLWSAPWINGWVNNREAGDLRRHRAHYGVIVMMVINLNIVIWRTVYISIQSRIIQSNIQFGIMYNLIRTRSNSMLFGIYTFETTPTHPMGPIVTGLIQGLRLA